MKKYAIIKPIIILLALISLTTFLYVKTKDQLVLSKDFAKTNTIYVASSSNDETIIKKDSETLKKRIELFGGKDVTYCVDGNKIVFEYVGDVDNAALRSVFTSKGQLSILNSSDETAIEVTDLADKPLDVFVSEDVTGINVYVKNVDAVATDTVLLALSSDYIVFWVDKEEGQTFKNELENTNPSFLACATVSSKMSGDFYLQSKQDYETTKKLVNLVNSGTLISVISEVNFDVTYVDSIDIVKILYFCILAISVIFGIYQFIKFRTIALANMTAVYVYGICFVIFTNFLDAYISIANIICLFVSMFEITYIISISNTGLVNKDNNISTLEKYKINSKELINSIILPLIIKFIIGIVSVLIFKEYKNAGVLLAVSACLDAIVLLIINVVIGEKLVVEIRFSSNKHFGFSKLLSSKIVYIVIALVFVLALSYLYAFNTNMSTLKTLALVILTITALTAAICLLNKKTKNLVEVFAVIVGALVLAMALQIGQKEELVNLTNVLVVSFVTFISYGLYILNLLKQIPFKNKKKSIEEDKELINSKINQIFNIDSLIVTTIGVISSIVVSYIIGNISKGIISSAAIIVMALLMNSLAIKIVLSNIENK